MNPQPELMFPAESPINQKKLGGQCERLYNWLASGRTIHVFHPAKRELRIGYINSRISDLKKAGIVIYKRMITVPDINGEPTYVKEYSLKPFDL